MTRTNEHFVASRDPKTGQLWLKGTEVWQERHFCRAERFMKGEQMRGVCAYPVSGHEICDTCCESCEYCNMPYRTPASSRMRHISELLDEVLEDLSAMREEK